MEPLDRSHDFLCRSSVAVARSFSGGVAIPGRSLMSMNALFGYCNLFNFNVSKIVPQFCLNQHIKIMLIAIITAKRIACKRSTSYANIFCLPSQWRSLTM